jgi:protein ImuA
MPPTSATTPLLEELRARIARLEQSGGPVPEAQTIPFGLAALDGRLPGKGLQTGALHEVAGAGPGTEHGAAATLMVAGILARIPGQVLWVVTQRDLFTPALAAVGLHPDRIIIAEAGQDVLLVMEEGLRHRGLAGVVGEVGTRLTLTASRRLQLAAEQSGVTAIALRRSRQHDDPALSEPTAALTRWRVAAVPAPPPLPHAPETPGLGWPRWLLELTRCRGGEPASWIVEACDAQGRLHLATDMADRPPATEVRRRAAGG